MSFHEQIDRAAAAVRTARATGDRVGVRRAERELEEAYMAKRAARAEAQHGTTEAIKRRARMEMELARQAGAAEA